MIIPNRKRPYSNPSSCLQSISSIAATRLATFILKLLGGLRLQAPYYFDPHKTYLVLSNHQSRLDPFTIYGSLGLRQNIICAPTKFLTAKGVYYSFLWLWLKSMGCYPTKNRSLTVPETVNYLKKGYSVCLFPEGRRTIESESTPRDGTRLILDEIRRQHLNIVVVLAHIEWEPYRLFRKATVRLAAAPIDIYEQSVSDMMRAIYSLK